MTKVLAVTGQKSNNLGKGRGIKVAIARSSQPDALFAKPTKEIMGEATPDSTPLNDWMNECADSVIDVDSNGNPIYSKDVAPFDLAGKEYEAALAKGDTVKADEILKTQTQQLAQDDIKNLYDKNHNDTIDSDERVNYDVAEYTKDYKKQFQTTPPRKLITNAAKKSQKLNKFMDLNGDKKVDREEYASFLCAMSALKKKDGKLDREEYAEAVSYFENTDSKEAKSFKTAAADYYKKFFGKKDK